MNMLRPTILPTNPLPTKVLKWSIENPTISMIVSFIGIVVALTIIGIMIYLNKKNN